MREYEVSLSAFSRIRRESTIVSLYGRIRGNENLHSCIFHVVFNSFLFYNNVFTKINTTKNTFNSAPIAIM